MDIWLLLKAVVMGIVEGITEFLPISSTGHLILAGTLMDFHDDKAKLFEIFIQSGAILAVCWEYRRRLLLLALGLPNNRQSQALAFNIAVAFVPLALLGVLFHDEIKAWLFSPVAVASAFIVGGILIFYVEQRYRRMGETGKQTLEEITLGDAIKVGLIQALALIPGTSRSGASIIGGMWLGLSRKTATEFSFFLAIPTLVGASVYAMYKEWHLVSFEDVPLFSVGFFASFVAAFACMRWLLRFVERHDFIGFAWYRIGFGVLILATDYAGLVNWYQG